MKKPYFKIISALVCLVFALGTTGFAFSDVAEDHWAKDYISSLSQKGIIKGYEDSSFRPGGNITKAEFAAMTTRAFELSGQKEFSDISGHWAQDYIEKSAIYFYNPTDTFSPDQMITRGEVAFVLSGVLNLEAPKGEAEVSDVEFFDAAMKDKILSSIESGLMKGYEDGTFRVSNLITRAEASALFVRALEIKEAPSDPSQSPEEEEKPEDGVDTEKELKDALYPMRNLLVVKSATTAIGKDGDEVRKITFSVAGDEQKSHVLELDADQDVSIIGTRDDVMSIKQGDVFVADSPFYGYIGTLAVVASLGGDLPLVSIPEELSFEGSAKVKFVSGTVVSVEKKSQASIVTLNVDGSQKELIVPKSAPIVMSDYRSGKAYWQTESISYLDEGDFALMRIVEGDVAEVIFAK